MVDQDNKDPGEVLAGASPAPTPEAPASPAAEGAEPPQGEALPPEAAAPEAPPPEASSAPEPPADGGASSLSAAAVSALLDAAETANDVAQAAERMGQSFHGGMTELNTHLGGIQKLNKTIVYAMGGILFLGLLVFVYMATTLTVRLSRLDATLEAVGTRVVKQAAGLRELESIREAMGVVAETQRDLLMAQDRLTISLQDTQQRLESLPSTVPSALEPRIDSAFAEGMLALNGRVDALGNALGAQDAVLKGTTEALQGMAKRVAAVDAQTRSLLRLEADVEALVTLTRERYLEALEAQLEIGDTGPRLRYPPPRPLVGDAPMENKPLTGEGSTP